VIRLESPENPGLTVFGVVRGLVREADRLTEALESLAPQALALGLSREEAESLTEHFVGAPTEPLVPLLSNETAEIHALARFGEVRVPNPGFLAALEFGRRHGVSPAAIDPSEEQYAEMFGDEVGYVELVRRTLRERRLLRSPPKTADADDFIVEWDRRLNHGSGSRRLQLARDRVAVEGVHRLLAGRGRVAAIFDRERIPGLTPLFGTSAIPR
jgi:hypothetical protein